MKMGIMRRCVKTYSKLNDLVDAQCSIHCVTGEIKKVRDHAVELIRQCIQEELADLKNSRGLEEEHRAMKKDSIPLKVRRLMPGVSTVLNAMRSEEGTIHNDAREMADILRKHWGKTFSRRDIDKGKLAEWMTRVFDVSRHGSSAETMWGIRFGERLRRLR